MTEPASAGWPLAKLGDVCEPVSKRGPDRGKLDFRYVDLSSIDNEQKVLSNAKFVPIQKTPSRAKQQIRSGDVLFSTVRVYLENICLVPKELDGEIASTAFCVLRPGADLYSKYLYYYVASRPFVLAVNNLQRGNSPPSVQDGDVRGQHIPLPLRDQQVAIADKIDELFSEIDEGERALARAQKLVERYRQSVLKAAVTGELTRDWREEHQDQYESGEELLQRILKVRREAWEKTQLEKKAAKGAKSRNDDWKRNYKPFTFELPDGLPDLPNGWVWSTLGQLFEVFVGGTPSRKEPDYWNGDFNWVSSGEVAFCRISSTRETISEQGLQNSSVRLHPPGTVLLAMIGEGKTRGQAAILDITAGHNQNAASIRVGDTPIPPEYIFWLLKFRYEAVRAMGQGGNQPALNGGLVKEIPVPLPPLAEAWEICDRLEVSEAAIRTAAHELLTQGERSVALRQSILKAAFSGPLGLATESAAA